MEMSRSDERELFQQVLAIVNKYDFCSLLPGEPDGVPIDEHAIEARPIESILVNRGRIAANDIRAIWLKWFSDDLASQLPAVEAMADELNALVDPKPS